MEKKSAKKKKYYHFSQDLIGLDFPQAQWIKNVAGRQPLWILQL